jgi:RNAse (barnase) inhibitor barstar
MERQVAMDRARKRVRGVAETWDCFQGMTNANLKIVTVDVKLPDGDLKPPKAQLEEVCRVLSRSACLPALHRSGMLTCYRQGEHIIQRVVEVSKLYDILKGGVSLPLFILPILVLILRMLSRRVRPEAWLCC